MDKLSQLDKLVDEFNDDDEDEYEEGHHLGYLPSSLKEIIFEFEKHKLIKKYNNDVGGEPSGDPSTRLQQQQQQPTAMNMIGDQTMTAASNYDSAAYSTSKQSHH